jgi:FeS assembly SUF system regulator
MIRITRLTDYGIVLLSRFAGESDGTVLSARELSSESGIPLPTVSKILKTLTREGLLVSHRGTQGGYSLARPPSAVSIADVIGALEGPIALTECAGEEDALCEIAVTCPVRSNWQRITDAIRDALAAIPLEDMTVQFPMHHKDLTGDIAAGPAPSIASAPQP